ncbi:Uncharacterised protein [Escherichia coli]|nr:Uncharacterised protein [Escherichia coli]
MAVCTAVGIGHRDTGKQVHSVQFMFFVKADLNMGVIITVTTVCRTGTTHDARPGSGITVCVMQVTHTFVQIVDFRHEVFIPGIHETVSLRGSGFISLRFKTVQYPLRIATTGVNMQGWSHPTETCHPGAGLKHLC